MSAQDFQLSGQFERDKIASMLEDMAQGLREGNVQLEKDSTALGLAPGDGVDLTILASSAPDHESFQLNLTWPKQS